MRWIFSFLILVSFQGQAFCFKEASQKYAISENLLKAIAYTESRFSPDALNCANSNQSCDYGLAQINLDAWSSKLSEFGITFEDLKDPCQNLMFGAWVLASNFHSHGRNWNSVGAYNAGFSKYKETTRQNYIAKVKANLALIEAVQGNISSVKN